MPHEEAIIVSPLDEKQTSLHINGFWFHIDWKNQDEGYDHRGNKWLNKKEPHLADEKILNVYLDISNSTKSEISKL